MAESGTEKELAKNDGISAENKFQAELFLNVFLPAADILKIADIRKENNRKVSVDDVMKNPRFEDACKKILEGKPAEVQEFILAQARNRVSRVLAQNAKGKDKDKSADGKKRDEVAEEQDLGDNMRRGKKKNFFKRMKEKIKKRFGKTSEKAGEKVVGKAGEKGAAKTTGKAAGKAASKAAGKTAGKAVAKATGKSLLKKIPLVGLGVGCYFAWDRIKQGDYVGALGEVASGAASCIPGAGTAVSVGIDAALAGKDIYQSSRGEVPSSQEAPQEVAPENVSSKDGARKQISRADRRLLLEKSGILQPQRPLAPVRQTQLTQDMSRAFMGSERS